MDKATKAKKFKQLSPAKKFRLKIRLAKYRKLQQAKQEYFEHDNRGAFASNPAAQVQRVNKKKRQTKKLLAAFHHHSSTNTTAMSQNGDAEARNGTQESSSNSLVKSVISFSSPQRSALNFVAKEQATHKIGRNLPPSPTTSIVTNTTTANSSMLPNIVKCCCHCACANSSGGKPTKAGGKQRKPRRKLSSPYFGEIDQIDTAQGIHVTALRYPNSNSTATTFVQSDTLKSSSEVFRIRKSGANLMKFNHIFENNFGSRASVLFGGKDGDNGDDCNVKQVRSVVRLVLHIVLNLMFHLASVVKLKILPSELSKIDVNQFSIECRRRFHLGSFPPMTNFFFLGKSHDITYLYVRHSIFSLHRLWG